MIDKYYVKHCRPREDQREINWGVKIKINFLNQ